MAEGIRRRHSQGCPAQSGRRCNCNAGWEASFYLAQKGRKVRRTFPRKAEAKAWRAGAAAEVRSGALVGRGEDRRTLYEVLVEFVADMATGKVRPRGRVRYKPNTIRSYERVIRLHVRDSEVGQLRPAQVRRGDVQNFVDELLAQMTPGSASNVLNPLQAYYRRAIHREDLIDNPTTGIDLPAAKSAKPRRIVAPTEAARLIAELPLEDRALWATAFYAGLRRGELQALRCLDVDLSTGLIHVRKGWDQEEGEIEPKSEAGTRAIPLLAILRRFLEGELERTGRTGEDRVFGRAPREVFYPSTVEYRAKRAWRNHNKAEREQAEAEDREADLLTVLTFHECRHTFASLLIDTGANAKAIQVVMGHSKIQTTFDIYGHLLPGSYDDVRDRMDAYLEAAC